MVGRFFFPTPIQQQQQMEVGEHNNSNDQMMLLAGPPSCGKTSLLFQFAFNSALINHNTTTTSSHVAFICNRRKLENNPPFLSQSIDPSSEVFQRIHIKYIEDDEGIKKYFASFHLHQTFPSLVIVDDFGDFFDESNCQERYGNQRGRDLAIVRTLALCQNAITHANEKLESRSSCKLILSDTQLGDTLRFLFIYKRWIPSVFMIKGDGAGSFILKNNISSAGGQSGGGKAAKYSIALQYLVLEEINDEAE